MSPDLLIVGQGLAGTLLAWACERAGLRFAVADAGHAGAASAVAAGIVNPVTGRRLVPTWRAAALLPLARTVYREIGDALGMPLWREARVRRFFADDRERAAFAAKFPAGELAPHVAAPADADGFWIEGAARVDLAALLAGTRARLLAQGRLRETPADLAAAAEQHAVVVDCTGRAGAGGGPFGFVPWEFEKGDVLELAVAGLDPAVILNRRHWLAPTSPGRALVGATHEPGTTDATPGAAARAPLEASARDLLGAVPFAVVGHRAGVRVTLRDKRPVAGRHPAQPRLGTLNALGAKGVLWAPWLAQQWVAHLATGAAFDPEIDVRRFAG